MTDRELLAQYAARGSQAAFAEIVGRHARQVYAACLRILGDAHAAEDAAQAVFLILARRAGKLPAGTVLAGWLHLASRQVALTARRGERRRARHEQEATRMRGIEQQGRAVSWDELRPRLDEALAALSGAQREVVLLRHLYGRSEEQAALELGWKRSRVSMTLARAVERLRARLGGPGAPLGAAALGTLLAEGAAQAPPAGLTAAIQAACAGQAAAPAAAASLAEGTMKAMMMAKVKLAAAVLGAALAAASGAAVGVRLAAAEPAPPALPEALKNAPPNTWVKLVESKTGSRGQPLFVYASGLRKFVLAGGSQGPGYGNFPRHYDTEEFDLAQLKWVNAYPPGAEKDRPESGPVGEKYSKEREMFGYNGGGGTFYKDGEFLRIVAGGQWAGVATNAYAWCYVPDNGRIYLSTTGRMFAYDTAGRTWQDLKVKPRDKCLIWGSMCHDPVNKEILHTGGGAGSADVSTWAYSLEKNEWRKLEFGSKALNGLFAKAKDLRWQAKDLLGRCSSRHAVAETAAESKVDLVAKAAELATATEKFAAEVSAAGLDGSEKLSGEVAAKRLNAAAAAVKAAGPTLSGAMAPEKIAAVRAAREVFEQAVDALAVEPPGRARSQTALDAADNKIVLFGGDGLDRALSDTWLYDTKTRSWEQRFPAKSPAPRAGHILGWLSGAKKIVLAGGYSRVPLAQELWSYDVGANEWKPLMCVPPAGGGSPNCPNVSTRDVQVGAVTDGDVLVCFSWNAVWAAKVDPAKPAAGAESAATAPAPGSYTWNTITPAIWEKAAQPDPAKTRKYLDELPVNQWTALKFPKYAPGATNRWGTSAYDTDRHQILLWGGGHATSHEDDVAHFSVLGGFWTIGYHPDDPIETVYAEQPTPLSFNDRRHVPIHAYKAYTYDPTAGKMFYFDRAYDPLVREWVPAPLPGLSHRGPMNSHMKATPAGAITYSDAGLFRFDAKASAWQKLPWNGPKATGAWCDGPCMIYDSKRNCLWMAYDKEMYKYDFAAGKGEKLTPAKPKALGQWLLPGESVYLPDADLILTMCPAKGADGKVCNYAWDPNDGKFYWVDLKFVDGGKEVGAPGLSWSDALAYDPELKLVLINNSRAQKVWALKFDRKTAKVTEMTE